MRTIFTYKKIIIKYLLIIILFFSIVDGFGQTSNGFTGNKTGNINQAGGLIGLGTGNAGISSPIQSHTTGIFNTFRFYYGDTILNTSGSTPVTVTASRTLGVGGLLSAGGDAYIQFRNAGNAQLSSGTITYIRLGSAPSITGLSASLGGLLGLSTVYDIKGYGYSGAGNYVLGGSYNENGGSLAGTIGGTSTEFLIDKNANWYIGITPDGNYNSVRLNVAFASGINLLSVSRDLDLTVHNAFYYSTPSGIDCGNPIFVTPGEVAGVSLNLGSTTQLLALDTALSNPHLCIDEDTNTYTRMTSGALGIATSISQTALFHGLGSDSDMINIRFSLPLSALTVAVLSNVTITAYNGSSMVGSTQSLSDLLDADVLGLLGDNTPFSINYRPGASFDRVKISLGNMLNIGSNILGGGLRIYEIVRVANAPYLTVNPVSDTVCAGEAAIFTASATGSQLVYNWQTYSNSVWSNIATGSTLNILNTTYSMNGKKYRVLVTGGYCSTSQASVKSQEATLTVNPLPITPPVQLSQ